MQVEQGRLQLEISEQAESKRVQLHDMQDRLARSQAECHALREQLAIVARAKAESESRAHASMGAAVHSETKLHRERALESEHRLRERSETLRRTQSELKRAQDQSTTLESTVAHLLRINDDLHRSVQTVRGPAGVLKRSARHTCREQCDVVLTAAWSVQSAVHATIAAPQRSSELHATPRRSVSKSAMRKRDKAGPASPSKTAACCPRHEAEPHRGCGEASAVAASVKVRNQKALKRHIMRSQQPRHDAPSDFSIASRLGRCATPSTRCCA